jgi:hypothetical protein
MAHFYPESWYRTWEGAAIDFAATMWSFERPRAAGEGGFNSTKEN